VVNQHTAGFFAAFSQVIEVREFDYAQQIKGTPWESDPFLGNHSLVRQYMPDAGAYTDLVRILLLHNYGGDYQLAYYLLVCLIDAAALLNKTTNNQ
jgi:hypothetical protein